MTLPRLSTREQMRIRLQMIFPEGSPHRGYCTRELAASTVFAALYIGAVEGTDRFFGPKHVYKMTEQQAKKTSDSERVLYAKKISKAGFEPAGKRWYRDNTREPIRDETLRDGSVPVGAVIEKRGVPTTSSKPRYALARDFANLFDQSLDGQTLATEIASWQAKRLSKGALARIAVVRSGAGIGGDQIVVSFPNGETRRLSPGPSAVIIKSVIENFATKFFKNPAVLLVSESGNKVVARDDALAKKIGIQIKVDKDLPDIILIDLGPEHPLLVFIEVVATDGPINTRRKIALQRLAADAGFAVEHIAFVTAYLDRNGAPFKKTVSSLAWGSYVWFASEPNGLITLSDKTTELG